MWTRIEGISESFRAGTTRLGAVRMSSAPPLRLPKRAPHPWLLRAMLAPLDRILAFIGSRYTAFIWLVTSVPPQILALLGAWRAVRAAHQARRKVPAYQRLLADHRVSAEDLRWLRLPLTDKDAYVRRFSLEERCLNGRLPDHDVAMDESSGSTGIPHNWVRSLRERETSHTFISHFARHCFGNEPFVTINAFSMGAWATGINMGIALQRIGTVKSTGPDVDKILSTLDVLGTKYRYLLCGYPPFLKLLIDSAKERGFSLADFSLMALVGGEGMSEGLRDYLIPYFSKVYSGFGATDLEIGIAGESPISVAIRREARRNERLREAVFGHDSRLPMLFQYNPLNHHVFVGHEGELIFTITRLEVLSPRIMYNLHDEGGVATFHEMEERLGSAGRKLGDIAPSGKKIVKLPFLWVYGRKDSTLSVMGANIYPEDIEQALYGEPELAVRTHSFCLSLVEDQDGGVRPCFSFEIRGEITNELRSEFENRLPESIRLFNTDFRVAMKEHAATATPIVRLFALGTGPFAADAGRIKQTRILHS